MIRFFLIFGLIVFTLTSCSKDETSELNTTVQKQTHDEQLITTPTTKRPNFLVLIGDDMGQETIGCFKVGDNPARTPTLNDLCNEGVRFNNFWTQPTCSPTRATILTGKYGFRSGVQNAVLPNIPLELGYPSKDPSADKEHLIIDINDVTKLVPERIRELLKKQIPESRGLANQEVTLAHLLSEKPYGYATAAFGKWHLADFTNGGLEHPEHSGFDHFSGAIDGTIPSYYNWHHVENGIESHESGYFTTRNVDDALDWIHQQDKPWFTWMAFTAPHDPFHKPPESLLHTDASKNLDASAISEDNLYPYYQAQIESLDAEIQRLINKLPEEQKQNTYIIFLGDNGPDNAVVIPPFERGKVKGTLHQGGINMPLFIYGPGVNNGVVHQLTNSTDLFSTILELADADNVPTLSNEAGSDSISLVNYLTSTTVNSNREFIYADKETGIGPKGAEQFALRDTRYKYINEGNKELFYDLSNDPAEKENLLESEELNDEQLIALENLKNSAHNLRNSRR